MTEIIETRTHWPAFIAALIGGPFWGTLIAGTIAAIPLFLFSAIAGDTFGLAFAALVTLYALPFGAPFYLTLGTLAFYIVIRLKAETPWPFCVAGFIANLFTPLALTLWSSLSG
ncbi:MAG: hypothetical protein AAFY59_06055, partial [Pseudomonadota bacterium]